MQQLHHNNNNSNRIHYSSEQHSYRVCTQPFFPSCAAGHSNTLQCWRSQSILACILFHNYFGVGFGVLNKFTLTAFVWYAQMFSAVPCVYISPIFALAESRNECFRHTEHRTFIMLCTLDCSLKIKYFQIQRVPNPRPMIHKG